MEIASSPFQLTPRGTKSKPMPMQSAPLSAQAHNQHSVPQSGQQQFTFLAYQQSTIIQASSIPVTSSLQRCSETNLRRPTRSDAIQYDFDAQRTFLAQPLQWYSRSKMQQDNMKRSSSGSPFTCSEFRSSQSDGQTNRSYVNAQHAGSSTTSHSNAR